MSVDKVRQRIFFLIILFFAFVSRFVLLSKIPSELNRDEASVGFNAYSLLKTRKDEHAAGPWPMVFRAFGDNKIPGYIYMVAPLIKVFGLNAFTVRFPSALFGSLTIAASYFFIKELFPKKKYLSLIFPFLLTVSPFHLHYSRQQFETTVALFFTLTGLTFLLKARKKISFLFLSLVFFVTSFFIYNTPLFIVPPLCLFTFFIFRKKYFQFKKSKLMVFLFLVLLGLGWLGYWNLAKEGNMGRANTTFFGQEGMIEEINYNTVLLHSKGIPIIFSRVINNKLVYWLGSFFENYAAAFNLKFIFYTSDNNFWHSISQLGYGNLLPIFIPFMILGFIYLIKDGNSKTSHWLFGFLLISAIGNGLTIDSPILTRLLLFHLALVLFMAIGLEQFCFKSSKKLKFKNIVLSIVLFFSISRYLINYFIVFPVRLHNVYWLPGIREVCLYIKENQADYDYFIFDKEIELGYIFPAFYLPFEPADFQTGAQRGGIGMDKVASFKNFYFDEQIGDWKDPVILKDKISQKNMEKSKKILLIDKLGKEEQRQEDGNNILIRDFLGKPLWELSELGI